MLLVEVENGGSSDSLTILDLASCDQRRGYEDIAVGEPHAVGYAACLTELLADLGTWSLVRRLGMQNSVHRPLVSRSLGDLHCNRVTFPEGGSNVIVSVMICYVAYHLV